MDKFCVVDDGVCSSEGHVVGSMRGYQNLNSPLFKSKDVSVGITHEVEQWRH